MKSRGNLSDRPKFVRKVNDFSEAKRRLQRKILQNIFLEDSKDTASILAVYFRNAAIKNFAASLALSLSAYRAHVSYLI